MQRIPEKEPLTDAEWNEMWLKLRHYTWSKYRWLHQKTGKDLDEIVSQALLDTFSGIRNCPPGINLFQFLCGTVQSIVSHTWAREKTGRVLRLEEFRSSIASQNLYLVIDSDEDYQRLTNKMIELVSYDTELTGIVRLWRSDPDLKPRDLAKQLGLSMAQIYAAKKRLRRALKDLQQVLK
ncbi:MAG TPA: hypothetical protein VJM50_08940 [Pyrinomonadaceae bacterium]|nr:hypothetical protein [Pyrinomonadaceae bacterium]